MHIAMAAEMTLDISGLSGDVENNVNARLSVIPKSQYRNSIYFKRTLEDEITKGVNALGYYEPKINFNYVESKNRLEIDVDLGEPIYVKAIDVDFHLDGKQNEAFNTLLEKTLSHVGEILNQGTYDAFKNRLQSLALSLGYFDAEFTRSQLGIVVEDHAAYWWIDYNLKTRYQFGEVTFVDSQIRDSYLENITPFKTGDDYTSQALSLLNYNLSSTNWFSSVTILPQSPKHLSDGSIQIPIKVTLEPKKKNQFNIGLGYASDNGMRGSFTWNKPWINDRGHSIQTNLKLSQSDQEYGVSYKIPLHRSALNDYYTVQGKYTKTNNSNTDLDSNAYTVGIARNWDRISGWQRTLGINLLYDEFTQVDTSYHTFLFYPSASLAKVNIEDSLYPLRGRLQRYSLEVASESLLSNINMIRFMMQQSWITSFSEDHRIMMRLNVGYIATNDFNFVPPSFRFFAGGDRSIRGYKYQSISPEASDGSLLGGSKMVTGSIEYDYHITGDWWGAVFVDSGQVTDSIEKTNIKTGAGMGVRWISPVGPIKLDIATPVFDDSTSLHLYIGLGTDL